jgi:hypothetical protein
VRNKSTYTSIIKEFQNLLTTLGELFESLESKTIATGFEVEELALYKEFISNLHAGIKIMIAWIVDENEPDEKFKESVDLLFTAGQKILELVNRITKD